MILILLFPFKQVLLKSFVVHRSRSNYTDSEERPLAEIKRQKVSQANQPSGSSSREKRDNLREESSSSRDLRFRILEKRERRRILITSSSSESDDEQEGPKLKSVIGKIKKLNDQVESR